MSSILDYFERFSWERFVFDPRLQEQQFGEKLLLERLPAQKEPFRILNDPTGALTCTLQKFHSVECSLQDSDLAWKSQKINAQKSQQKLPKRFHSMESEFYTSSTTPIVFAQRSTDLTLHQLSALHSSLQSTDKSLWLLCSNQTLTKKLKEWTTSHFEMIQCSPFVGKRKVFEFKAKKPLNSGKPPSFFLKDLKEIQTFPGVFSWNQLDQGSKLLIENFPVNQKGKWLDLGSGTGVLLHQFLKNNPGVEGLACDENAVARALTLKNNAGANVRIFGGNGVENLKEPLDGVFSNLPQHVGSALDLKMTQDLVKQCTQRLKPGGNFYTVLTQGIQAEKLFSKKAYHSIEKLASAKQFIVWKATKT